MSALLFSSLVSVASYLHVVISYFHPQVCQVLGNIVFSLSKTSQSSFHDNVRLHSETIS